MVAGGHDLGQCVETALLCRAEASVSTRAGVASVDGIKRKENRSVIPSLKVDPRPK